MTTTPLEREILTHYATSEGPYRGGPANWTETHVRLVQRFVELGLLIADPAAEGRAHVRPNAEALRAYMAALAAVPLPVRRWVVPTAGGTPHGNAGAEGTAPAQRDDALAARIAALELEVRELNSRETTPRTSRYEGEDD